MFKAPAFNVWIDSNECPYLDGRLEIFYYVHNAQRLLHILGTCYIWCDRVPQSSWTDPTLRMPQLSIFYPKPIECPSSWWNWTYSKF